MFSSMKRRMNIPLVVSIGALVFAMVGGAWASTGNGGHATASAKKGPPGPRGPKGKTGPVGPGGPAGPQGSPGAAGAKGDTGPKGDKGEKGEKGKTGDPWTAGGTLPINSTETGVYGPLKETSGFSTVIAEGGEYQVPIFFNIPLATAPTFVYVLNSGDNFGTAAGCPGVTSGIPKADSGKLCVYVEPNNFSLTAATVTAINPAKVEGTGGPQPSGAILRATCPGPVLAEICPASGLWAVTG